MDPISTPTRPLGAQLAAFALIAILAALAVAVPASAGEIAYERDSNIWLMSDNGANQRKIINQGLRPHIDPRGGIVVFQAADGTGVYKYQNYAVTKLSSPLANELTEKQWALSPEAGGDNFFYYTFQQGNPMTPGPPSISQIRGQSIYGTGLGSDMGVSCAASGLPSEPAPNPSPAFAETAYTGCISADGHREVRIIDASGDSMVGWLSPGLVTQASYAPDGYDLVYVWRSAELGGNSRIYISDWNGGGYASPRWVLNPPAGAVITSPRFLGASQLVFGYDDGAGGLAEGIYRLAASAGSATMASAQLLAPGGADPAWVASSIHPAVTPPVTTTPTPPSTPLTPSIPKKAKPSVSKTLSAQLTSAARTLSKLGAKKLRSRKGLKISRFRAVVRGTASGKITARGTKFAAGSKRFTKAGRKTLFLKLTSKGRRALNRAMARGRSFKVKLTLKFNPRSGRTVTKSKTVRLKVPKLPPKPTPDDGKRTPGCNIYCGPDGIPNTPDDALPIAPPIF